MAQWDVYPNPSARSREDMPYLVDLQSNLLDVLPTRLQRAKYSVLDFVRRQSHGGSILGQRRGGLRQPRIGRAI